MSVTQYVGARYVPLFSEPMEWASSKEYEPLTIVYHEGNSYTSRQYVPAGIDIAEEKYWALTGNYNAQIEQYRKEVAQFDERITANEAAITGKAPISHASAGTEYGAGDAANYGHVKLADAVSDSDASAGIAATPKMVKNAISRAQKSILKMSSEYIGTFKSATSGLQGGCIVDNAYICFSENNLYSFNIKTGNLLNSKANIDLGHGNSLTYNAKTKKIYAYGNFKDSTVYVIDPATLEIESTFMLSDKAETNFTVNSWGYALIYVPASDSFYAFGTTNVKEQTLVLKFDGSFNYVGQFINPKIGINILGACAMPNTDHILVFYSGPKALVEYDAKMNLIATYELDNLASGCVHIDEIESMGAYNDDIMFLFKTSRSKNYQLAKVAVAHENVNLKDEFAENVCECYVNNAYTGFVCNGTQTAPFNDINDAIALGFDFDHVIIRDVSTDEVQKTADFKNVKNKITLFTNETVAYALDNISCDLTVNEINLVSMVCNESPATRVTSNKCVGAPTLNCSRSTVYMNGKTVEKLDLAKSSFNGNTNVSFGDVFRLHNQSIVSDTATDANVAYTHGVYATGTEPGTLNGKYVPSGPGILTLTVNNKAIAHPVVGIAVDYGGILVRFDRSKSWLRVGMASTSGITNWDYQKL